MNHKITAAGVSVLPGEKKIVDITVPETDGYTFPAVLINGKTDGKIFLATAGVHGAEFPGIEALVELGREIDPEEVKGAILFIPVVNTPAFYGRRAYVCPADEEQKNFNHVFPGNSHGTIAEKVAAFITEEFVKLCDFHVDLHSGDIVEDLEEFCAVGNTSDPDLLSYMTSVAEHTGFTHRINSRGECEVYNRTVIDMHKPALLFERGGQGLVKEEETKKNKADLVSLMRFLHILPGEPINNAEGQIFYPRHFWGEAKASGCFRKFVKTGDEVQKGQLIGEITDFQGNVLEAIRAEFNGRIKISNNTLGITKGDDTFMYGSPFESD